MGKASSSEWCQMLSESQKAEREARLRLMSKSLIDGWTPTDIIRATVEEFKITERQAWRDLKTIRARWVKAGEEDRLVNLHKAVLRRNDLYRRALAGQDILEALKIEQDLSKLLGLYPPRGQALQHTSSEGGPIKIVSIEAIQPATEARKEQSPAPGTEAAPPAVISIEAVEPLDMA
jgi:hypothetical protein